MGDWKKSLLAELVENDYFYALDLQNKFFKEANFNKLNANDQNVYSELQEFLSKKSDEFGWGD